MIVEETDPHLQLEGARLPTLAIYEDGLLIAVRRFTGYAAQRAVAVSARLPPEKARWFVADLLSWNFARVPRYLCLDRAFDVNIVDIYIRGDHGWLHTRADGLDPAMGDGCPVPGAVEHAYQRALDIELPGMTAYFSLLDIGPPREDRRRRGQTEPSTLPARGPGAGGIPAAPKVLGSGRPRRPR